MDAETAKQIRGKYGIPLDKTVFVYGGNLGKPQGIPFLIECLKTCRSLEKAYFLIVGDGTEYGLLESYINSAGPGNAGLMRRLPKEDYDTLVGACDIGMIFLDHRFTIPNFPSRLLSYMQAKLPVLAATDTNTDIGKVITAGKFGWWCESSDAKAFKKTAEAALKAPLKEYGKNSFDYLCAEYSADAYVKQIAEFAEKK